MSQPHLDSSAFNHSESHAIRSGHAEQSFLESFISSFFQEKNIKWLLIVGAAIVFGSSLMLVTKAWPEWTPALRYLTILGYTAATFGVAQVSRKRLNLNATSRVLHALTLLLLPVCFLSLTWLSAGTAVQNSLQAVWHGGLLIPAMGLLWIASSRILDHWLRGRQTTFLVSYCLLCVAGGVPPMTSPLSAFALMAIAWLVFTAGVMKVNRHTFWLSEEHRLPRVFGFLPVAILGLQFVVVVGVKAASSLPMQWIGFAIVMVAATILMTSRTVADVFRQRTGDLVRPLPWPIAVPMFSGLVLTVIGLGFSMAGFSYVGPTTYAVIPAAIVAAILFGLVARDTRHSGLVWASLVALTIAYQCSPTLFSDLVAALRAATADAINRQRVPLSMYGLTYLPLLGVLAAASRYFALRGKAEFSQPIKHYVTLIATFLFAIALSDNVSLWIVSSVNVVASIGYAIALRDRRYMLASIVSLVVACGTAVPALGAMGYANISNDWIPTALSGLAALMTVFAAPDRMLNRLPIAGLDRSKDYTTPTETRYFGWAGCSLAGCMALHWLMASTLTFGQPLTDSLLLQFGFLIAALVLFTVRNPHYLGALSVWSLIAWATLRWAMGIDVGLTGIAEAATYILIASSLASYAANKWVRPSVFAVSLFDLSVVLLSTVIVTFHLPCLLYQHAATVIDFPFAFPIVGVSTPLTLAWLVCFARIRRNRESLVAASMMLPMIVTSTMLSAQIELSPAWMLVVWAATQSILLVLTKWMLNRGSDLRWITPTQNVAYAWLLALLVASCLSFDMPLRLVAVIAVAALTGMLAKDWNPDRRGGLAILANIQVLLGVASLAGCTGWTFGGLVGGDFMHAIPAVFLTVSGSVLVFDRQLARIGSEPLRTWTWVLRAGAMLLAMAAIVEVIGDPVAIAMITIGFALLVVAESLQAIGQNSELRVWSAQAVAAVAAGFLFVQNVISFGVGISQFVLLALSITALSVAYLSQRHGKYAVVYRPMAMVGLSLPAIVAVLAVLREFAGFSESSTVLNAMSLMLASAIYVHQSLVLGRKGFSIPALGIANVGLIFMWRALGWSAPELYLVPIGMSVLGFVELMKDELPQPAHNPLRYVAALTILCSPMFEILGGDWVHILALMLLSVAVILSAIGLRLRALVYTGSAFLCVDLVAMVVRSTIHNLNLLWICGVVLGACVIALAAFCENHRDKLLSRIRIVSAELARWN